jgi:hypothetical protein
MPQNFVSFGTDFWSAKKIRSGHFMMLLVGQVCITGDGGFAQSVETVGASVSTSLFRGSCAVSLSHIRPFGIERFESPLRGEKPH